jgi:hypothetical protein
MSGGKLIEGLPRCFTSRHSEGLCVVARQNMKEGKTNVYRDFML